MSDLLGIEVVHHTPRACTKRVRWVTYDVLIKGQVRFRRKLVPSWCRKQIYSFDDVPMGTNCAGCQYYNHADDQLEKARTQKQSVDLDLNDPDVAMWAVWFAGKRIDENFNIEDVLYRPWKEFPYEEVWVEYDLDPLYNTNDADLDSAYYILAFDLIKRRILRRASVCDMRLPLT